MVVNENCPIVTAMSWSFITPTLDQKPIIQLVDNCLPVYEEFPGKVNVLYQVTCVAYHKNDENNEDVDKEKNRSQNPISCLNLSKIKICQNDSHQSEGGLNKVGVTWRLKVTKLQSYAKHKIVFQNVGLWFKKKFIVNFFDACSTGRPGRVMEWWNRVVVLETVFIV